MRKINVLAQRTKMCGGGLSYNLYVPLKECTEKFRKNCTHMSILNSEFNNPYVSFVQATTPDSHLDMERGIERWEDWKAHEKAANAKALELARQVFPELMQIDKWPELWVDNLMPNDQESSKEIWVTYEY